MIDSVKLKLPLTKRLLKYTDQFSPNAYTIFSNESTLTRSVLNSLVGYSGYFPQITLVKSVAKNGFINRSIYIEFSVTKLLLGNNIFEVDDADFIQVIENLSKVLNQAGILLNVGELSDAQVNEIHFSKNIPLAFHVPILIHEISKVDLGKRLDVTETRYMNDGSSTVFHNKSWMLSTYDKLAEVKDRKLCLQFIEKGKQIFRIELRLKRRKLIEVLKKHGYTSTRFIDLFSSEISKSLLLEHWIEIENAYKLVANVNDPLLVTALNSVDVQSRRPVQKQLGEILLNAISSSYGERFIRNVFFKGKDRGYYDSKKLRKQLSNQVIPSYSEIFKEIRNQITEFRTIKNIHYIDDS